MSERLFTLLIIVVCGALIVFSYIYFFGNDNMPIDSEEGLDVNVQVEEEKLDKAPEAPQYNFINERED